MKIIGTPLVFHLLNEAVYFQLHVFKFKMTSTNQEEWERDLREFWVICSKQCLESDPPT